MRYKSKEEAHEDHLKNYRSDGVKKGKGRRYASDFYRVQRIIDSVPNNAYVLDVGCNTGTISLRLQQKGCFVKGIDLVPELVEKAKKNGVFAEQGTAEDLSRFSHESFDVVVCTEVLEHLYDPLPAVREAHRVLKKGGSYLVSIPHPHSIMADKLGDFHQTNYGVEEIDTIFHNVFPRGSVMYESIPYTQEYAAANALDPNQPQWLVLEAKKVG